MPDEELKRKLGETLRLWNLKQADADILRDCFLQHNRIDSCAWKLNMSRDEVRLWYLRLTLWQTKLEMTHSPN